MKVIIADDERLIRLALRSMIEETSLNIQIVEAKNGIELVRLVDEYHPELVFVDIRMPGLNGLEAMDQGSRLSPHTQWVVLTGFSDFEYAREALRLRVVDYLLKPLGPDDLKHIMDKVTREHEVKAKQISNLFETAINSLLHQTRTIEEISLKSPIQDYLFSLTLFSIDSPISEQEKAKLRLQWIRTLKETFARQVPFSKLEHVISFFTFPNGSIAQIIGWHKDVEQRMKDYSPQLNVVLNQLMKDFETNLCIISGIQSESFMELFDLEHRLLVLQGLQPLLRVLPSRRLRLEEEVRIITDKPYYRDLSTRVDRLCKLASMKDFFQYTNELKHLEPLMKSLAHEDPKALEHLLESLNISLGCKLEFTMPIDQCMKVLQSVQENRLAEESQVELTQGDLVQRVLHYVNLNYMKDIGIGQIAMDMDVTPNYLSSLFHKKMGETFTKYLTHIRMVKAKELLLRNPGLKVQEVAEQVGYYSTRHFTKLFLDHFDCYPSEMHQRSALRKL
ncbi:response regulator [Paenibacillus sp. FSL P4-0184]|uniref:response regulator n=1 Tax=Paenibacillus sp. FSL P4-0184 TaxID=2921632 RepID=UPI0030FB2098